MKKPLKMADEVIAANMAGDTPLEKELNALITKAFIGSKDLPDDECLSEARHIIKLRQEHLRNRVVEYLLHQFWGGTREGERYNRYVNICNQTAEEIDYVMTEKRFMNGTTIVRIS